MSVSEVSICNSALLKIGAAPITSLTQDTVESRLCKEQFAKVRDDLLRAHPWNFAVKRASLALLAEVPAFGYSYAFALPSDYIRMIKTDIPTEQWTIESGQFLCNFNTANVQYIRRVEAVGEFDTSFAEVLACKLAHDICYSLVQSVALKAAIWQDYERKLTHARSFNGQEKAPPQVYAKEWLNSRY